MTDSELQYIVSEFRRGILGRRTSYGMCFVICLPLRSYLAALGCDTELMEADFGHTNHIWLQLPDGRIIDPTADQFQTPEGGKMPKVYIGALPEWYKAARRVRGWR